MQNRNGANFHQSEIYHITGPESLTRYEFISKMVTIFNFNPKNLQLVADFKQKAPRPANSALNNLKVQKLNIYKSRDVTSSFQYLKHIYEKSGTVQMK